MGFRENLHRKIHIDRLSTTVIRSIDTKDSAQRIDLEAMRQLIEIGEFNHQRERDLDLFFVGEIDGLPHVLVLDNELKIYRTTIEDIVLRKSPTVKEMVSIRNAIKILNDKDVVETRKADTVHRIQQSLIADLDLSYTATDIEAMVKDGQDALSNNYLDGITEIIELFAELLDYRRAPKSFQVAHFKIWGRKEKKPDGQIQFGPMVAHGLMNNSLVMDQAPVGNRDIPAMDDYHLMIEGERPADVKGAEVFTALKDAVMQKGV